MSKEQTPKGRAKTRVGFVVSDKMDKTAVVTVNRRYMHPMYKKYVKKGKNYKAHDEQEVANAGDKVLIEEVSPISKSKRWIIRDIIEEAPSA
jgi:small subunit ribosomal protein S17